MSDRAIVPETIALFNQKALKSRGFFYVGGKYTGDKENNLMVGQMYVEVYVPKVIRHKYPLIFIHGAAQTGCCFMYTPDGRPGWVDYFIGKGYVVYVVDQPERGRSICHRELRGDRITFSAQTI